MTQWVVKTRWRKVFLADAHGVITSRRAKALSSSLTLEPFADLFWLWALDTMHMLIFKLVWGEGVELFQQICHCLIYFIIKTSGVNLIFRIFLKIKNKKNSFTVQMFCNLLNHPTFHSEERLVNLPRGRECFVGLSLLLFCRDAFNQNKQHSFTVLYTHTLFCVLITWQPHRVLSLQPGMF